MAGGDRKALKQVAHVQGRPHFEARTCAGSGQLHKSVQGQAVYRQSATHRHRVGLGIGRCTAGPPPPAPHLQEKKSQIVANVVHLGGNATAVSPTICTSPTVQRRPFVMYCLIPATAQPASPEMSPCPHLLCAPEFGHATALIICFKRALALTCQALQCLDARLHQRRAVGVVPELVDEGLRQEFWRGCRGKEMSNKIDAARLALY